MDGTSSGGSEQPGALTGQMHASLSASPVSGMSLPVCWENQPVALLSEPRHVNSTTLR